MQIPLKCIEVDASGAPLAGNHLKGEATLVATDESQDLPPGDVAKYNTLGILGLETLNDDPVLCLGGEPTEECPLGAEYNACPQTWILNHIADGGEDPVVGGDSEVHTDITVVPCAEDFETQVPESVTIQFDVTDEFETSFSASTTVTCWAELDLGDISNVFSDTRHGGPIQRTFVQTHPLAAPAGRRRVKCNTQGARQQKMRGGGLEPPRVLPH